MLTLQVCSIILTVFAPALIWALGRHEPDGPRVRAWERGWAALLLAFFVGEFVMKYFDGTLGWKEGLPMQLCDWALLTVATALWCRWRMCFEVTYFWGLAGTLQALFTPAIPDDLHWFRKVGFFVIHAGIVIGILHLLLTVRWRPTARSLWHLLVASEGYLAVALLTNYLTGGNYGFLAHKPATRSMLDLFSDTQWIYVLQINLAAFVFFAVLYLPWLLVDLARKASKP